MDVDMKNRVKKKEFWFFFFDLDCVIMFILRLCMFYFVFVDDFYEIFKIIYVSDSEEEKDEYFLVS